MSSIDKISPINPAALTGAKRVSSTTPVISDSLRQQVAGNGKQMPDGSQVSDAQRKEIAKAAKDVSGYIQNISRELNFSVDEELDRTVITVIDEMTGDVVRQIPSEEILELAKNLAHIRDKSTKGLLFQGDA